MESIAAVKRLRTVVIGSGNVASVIVPALERAGAVAVEQVYSPTCVHAEALAARLEGASAVCDPAEVVYDADLYIVAVKDDAIEQIGRLLKPNDAVWLHTSGSVDCRVLGRLSPNYGVFYPLQTFSKGVEVDMHEVPVFVEGCNDHVLDIAGRLARSVTDKVYEADVTRRSRLHAAAVFACNFTNHLWAVADDILRREADADLTVLRPLVSETVRKAFEMRPADGQTGPARRGDRSVIDRHKSLLLPDEAQLYETLSRHIMDYYERD